MALPKQYRLRHRRDFSRVYRAGVRRKSNHLKLCALKLKRSKHSKYQQAPISSSVDFKQQEDGDLATIQPTKIGISISTKVSKRATVRNRIKRQIKSAMFQLLPTFSQGWWIVITVRPGTTECDYWQFLRELEEMIKSLR